MQTLSKSEEQTLRKVKRAARELEHTTRKMEKELEDTQDLMTAQSLLGRLKVEKKVNKDTRLAKKLFRKTQKKTRVLKPKPKRRQQKRVVVLSVGGQSVEDEDGFQKVG